MKSNKNFKYQSNVSRMRSASVSDARVTRGSSAAGDIVDPVLPVPSSTEQISSPSLRDDGSEDIGEYALALAENLYLPSLDIESEAGGGSAPSSVPPSVAAPATIPPDYSPGRSVDGAVKIPSAGVDIATTTAAAFTPSRTLTRSPLVRARVAQVLTPAGVFKPRSISTPDTLRDVSRDLNREHDPVEVLEFEFEQPATSPQQILKRKPEELRYRSI